MIEAFLILVMTQLEPRGTELVEKIVGEQDW